MRFSNVFWGSVSRGIFFLVTLILSKKMDPVSFSDYGFFIGWVMAAAAISSYTVSNILKKDTSDLTERFVGLELSYKIMLQYSHYSKFIFFIALFFSIPIAGFIFLDNFLLFIGLTVSVGFNLFNAYFSPITETTRLYNSANSFAFLGVVALLFWTDRFELDHILFILLALYTSLNIVYAYFGVYKSLYKSRPSLTVCRQKWAVFFAQLFDDQYLRLILISIAVSVVGLPTLMVIQTFIKHLDESGEVIGYIFLATQFLNVANVVLTKFLQSSIPIYATRGRLKLKSTLNRTAIKSYLFEYLCVVVVMHLFISAVVYLFTRLRIFDFGDISQLGLVAFYLLAVLTSISWFFNELCVIEGKEVELLKANVMWSASALLIILIFLMANLSGGLFLAYAISVYLSRLPSLFYLNLVMFKS